MALSFGYGVHLAHFVAASDEAGRHAIKTATAARDLRERWPFISIKVAGDSVASMVRAGHEAGTRLLGLALLTMGSL